MYEWQVTTACRHNARSHMPHSSRSNGVWLGCSLIHRCLSDSLELAVDKVLTRFRLPLAAALRFFPLAGSSLTSSSPPDKSSSSLLQPSAIPGAHSFSSFFFVIARPSRSRCTTFLAFFGDPLSSSISSSESERSSSCLALASPPMNPVQDLAPQEHEIVLSEYRSKL